MATSGEHKTAFSPEPIHHWRIFFDYGTDFIWQNYNDTEYEKEGSAAELEELLGSYPPSVVEHYDAWVDECTNYFRKRCDETGDYMADIFATVSEEVAWNVTGYLLAWRIASEPHIGSIQFSADRTKYLLERGKETSITLDFLKGQVEILANGPSK